ncbi:mms19 nucleotide excision repair [Rhizophlyctis rosea]|uniref:MMS19 nucleotide excision repair protein n=1 Tax=Rhizophlyctis rosea TaxID=64517 RepID=A0AAD5S9X6_9FUNG|nr:mms19 nucleotide excision repair [Rhizophlyctis rosea]
MSLVLALEAFARAPVDSPEANAALDAIVGVIKSGNATILNLVEQLGPLLTHNDPFERAKGVGLLSAVVRKCEGDKVSRDTGIACKRSLLDGYILKRRTNVASVLLNFFLDRLADQPSVGETLKGILSLLEMKAISAADANMIPQRIFTELAIQTFQQTVRHSFFRIIDLLLESYLPAVKSLGSDFVSGYIQAMDGEKDPRNLLLAFRIVKAMVDSLDYDKYCEELFEVAFCYFPITFRPPPDDIYGITAEDLKGALRACVCATEKFAPYAMPVLIEKLSSSSGTAKTDAMDTLSSCAPIYGARPLLPHAEHIWDFLKEEIFKGGNDANDRSALAAIKAVTVAFSSTPATSSEARAPLEVFLNLALKDTLHNFKEPELKFAKTSGKMLMAAASASDPACYAISTSVIPVLLAEHKADDAPTRRKTVLEVILDFIVAAREVYGSIDVQSSGLDEDFVSPIVNFKDNLLVQFSSALTSRNEYAPLRVVGARGLFEMLMSRQLLAENEAGIIIQLLNQTVLDDPDEDVKAEALRALVNFAEKRPESVLQNSLPVFYDELPSEGWAIDAEVSRVEAVLATIAQLATGEVLFQPAIQRLLEKLDTTISKSPSDHDDVRYARALSGTMLAVLRNRHAREKSGGGRLIAECWEPVVMPLLCRSVSRAAALAEGVLSDEAVFDNIGMVFGVVVRAVDAGWVFGFGVSKLCLRALSANMVDVLMDRVQKRLLDLVFEVFVNGRLEVLPGLHDLAGKAFAPLMVTSPVLQKNLSRLFAGILTNCRAGVDLPTQDTGAFLREIIMQGVTDPSQILTVTGAKIVASVLNKAKSDGDISAFIESILLPNFKPELFSEEAPLERRRHLLVFYIWIIKALILRAHNAGYALSLDVIHLLAHTGLGRDAGHGFGIIVADLEDGTLTKEAFAVTRLLYKQRFFNYCLPLLVDGFHAAAPELKQYYLLALSHLLRNIPQQILLNEIPRLFPLLLSSLSSTDGDLKVATLDTFDLVLKEAPAVAMEHAGSIIDLLLAITRSRDPAHGNGVRVRIAALKTLGQVPASIEFSILFPHKQKVLKALGSAVDDPKRAVRREAVNTRAKWYMLLGPKHG